MLMPALHEKEFNNDERAELAKKALQNFAVESGNPTVQDAVIMNLLADMMHYCWQNQVDFEDLLEGARYQFEEQVPPPDFDSLGVPGL